MPIQTLTGEPPPPTSQVPDQIGLIESATGGTLPGTMTLTLSQSQMDDARLQRASRMLARFFDLPPAWFLEPFNQTPGAAPVTAFTDPVTGAAISLATARRMLRPHEPEVISRILHEISDEGTGEVLKTSAGLRSVPGEMPNPGRVAAAVRALAPLSGERFAFAEALSFAIDIGRGRTNIDTFAVNLAATARLSGLTPIMAAEIARRAADAGVTLRTTGDVATFVAPGAAGAIAYAAEINRGARGPGEAKALPAAGGGTVIPGGLRSEQALAEVVPGLKAKAELGNTIVAGLTMPGDFFASLMEAEKDYIKASEEIAARVKIPFGDSALGHFVGDVFDYAWRPFDAISRFVIHPGPLLQPFEYDASDRPGVTNLDDAMLDAWDILNGRTTAAAELEGIGVPPWLTMTTQLALGFWLDPVQIGFNALSRARAARTTFGLAEMGNAERRAEMVQDFLHSPVAKLGRARGKTVAEYLLAEANLAEDPYRFFGRAVRSFRARFATEGIHPLVAEEIWRFARSSRKLGLTEADQVEGINSVLMAAMGVTPPPGSLAEQIATHVEALNVKTARQLPMLLADGSAYVAPTERLTRDAEMAMGALDDAYRDLAHGQWRMVEVPHLGSPITRAEIVLSTSRLADSQLGKTLRATFQMLPKSKGMRYEVGIETGTEAVRDFERGLRGYETLSVDELAKARLQFSGALESTNPFREQLAAKIVQTWEREALARINLRYGIDEEMSTRILDGLESRLGGRTPTKAFAAFAEGGSQTIETLPILSRTQQANWLKMIDPYVYRQGIAETIGTWRKWRAAHYAAFGQVGYTSKAAIVPLRKFLDRSLDLLVRDLFLSWFKPLVVIRPAYILRVVGMEETGRFLGTLGLTRRMEAGKILGGQRALEAARAVGAEGVAARIERGARTTIDVPELEGLVEGPAQLTFLRPAMLADDPLFNTAMTHYTAASPRGIDRIVQDAISPNAWGAVARGETGFDDWWFNALAHEFGLDPLGRRYLDDIAHGLDQERSVARSVDWLTSPGDGMAEAKALMSGPYVRESLEIQVRKGVHYANDLTGSNADLAAAAREGNLTPAMLAAVPEDAMPLLVHGPLTSEAVLSKIGPAKRFVGWWAKAILQEPTNRFSRQTFGKSWQDRVYRSLVDTAQENGIAITPELLEGFASTSRRFAIEQTARIMFDFSRQGRLDQISRHVLMFVQPFLEFPVAWSRVIRQNPATAWHAVRMARAAESSGFMKVDPDTGELVIPMSWWAGAAPLLAAVTGGHLAPGAGGGWELSAPLTSFNLFAQSTFQFPTGKGIVGDLPIPLPSFNPEALYGLQRLLDATPLRADIKARLSSWLFAFGDLDPSRTVSLLPAYMRHFLEGAMPEWLGNETNLQTTHFMVLRQAMGLDPDPAAAAGQAREFSFLRAFFAFVFPAAPRINFPTAQLEDEFRALVDSTGSWSDGRAAFLEAHPGLDLVTMARTMWAQENTSPVAIPASQAVNELLNTKGAKDFARDHPMWVWAIIPSELRDGTLDPGAFFSQIASGQRVALTPSQFETKANVQRGWDAYFMLREGHLAWQEAHPLLGENDPSYDEENLDYKAAVAAIQQANPAWAIEYGNFTLSGVDPKVMGEARRLAADEMFAQTDVGKGLLAYFELRDPIERELARLGVHTIDTITAEKAGLAERYTAGVEQITLAHPDFGTAYRLFFAGDLQHVKTTAERAVDKMPEGVFDNKITPWWEHFETLRDGPNQAQTEGTRNEAYTAIRIFTNQAYKDFDRKTNPMILRWRLSDPNYRADYLVSLVSRPYAYLSLFDKTSLLGEKTSAATEKLWTAYAQMRGIISEREAFDPAFSSSKAYEGLEAWIRANALANETFRNQVFAASKWGYSFSKVIADPKLQEALFGTELGSESQSYWGAFLDSLGQIQTVVDSAKLGGSYDPKAKVGYNVLRATLLDYVNGLREASPQFKAQWDFLEDASGPDPAISYFMPVFGDYFGPLTGYPGD